VRHAASSLNSKPVHCRQNSPLCHRQACCFRSCTATAHIVGCRLMAWHVGAACAILCVCTCLSCHMFQPSRPAMFQPSRPAMSLRWLHRASGMRQWSLHHNDCLQQRQLPSWPEDLRGAAAVMMRCQWHNTLDQTRCCADIWASGLACRCLC
jgi:hypothetical protein